VKSKLGKGTEFIIHLPVTHEAPIEKINYKERKTSDIVSESVEYLPDDKMVDIEFSQNGLPHVLIVEDNQDVVEYIKTVLNGEYFTEVAVNGAEGITKALKSVPDIIICDVMMPEKDGYEVCRTLKEDFRTNHIPIVILTAKADQDSKINGLEHGADAYIIKPFDKKELLVRLEKLIEIRQKLKEKYSDLTFSASDKEKPKGLNEIFLQKVFENLDKNYQEETYTIDQLCIDTNVSRAQLHRKLIALTGRSTSDFIRHFRIKKAKEMLLTPDITISEIAYQVGFKDPNYFTKSFIKENGITPSQYRDENVAVQQ
jgi:YesN/AraC family two-component response regulator